MDVAQHAFLGEAFVSWMRRKLFVELISIALSAIRVAGPFSIVFNGAPYFVSVLVEVPLIQVPSHFVLSLVINHIFYHSGENSDVWI